MTTIELVPCEYTTDPRGVLHLTPLHPSLTGTLCGESIRKNWEIGDDTVSGSAATCLPCVRELALRKSKALHPSHGYMALNGVDRCECGCKYWENDQCIDCGAEWTSVRLDDDD